MLPGVVHPVHTHHRPTRVSVARCQPPPERYHVWHGIDAATGGVRRLVLAIGVAVAVVGVPRALAFAWRLRVIDAEGNVQVVGAWRLGSAAGSELPAVASGDLRFELSHADGVRHSFVVVRTELEGTDPAGVGGPCGPGAGGGAGRNG